MKTILRLFIFLMMTSSCATLKPYDMVYQNDPEMQMGNSTGKNHEQYIESIREGATPAGGSKSSGGCGCN